MNQGIQLSFEGEGQVETIIPGKEQVACLTGKVCQLAKTIIQPEGYGQLFCEFSNKPVFDLFSDERRCPKDKWFRANQLEEEPVQSVFSL